MKKILCTVCYDGTNFSGYQIQPQKRTIQGEVEQALKKIHKGNPIRIHASGRTDTGVHAKGQTFHFETNYQLPLDNWKKALNTNLSNDLYITEVTEVPMDFHARYDIVEKEYRYYVYHSKDFDVFRRNYSYHLPFELDVDLMKEACQYFQGTHDFTTFSSAKSTAKGSKERHMYEVSIDTIGNEVEFIFRGSGFLYNMVRIMVGTLIEVGKGKLKPVQIKELLEKKDRRLAGKTAPPQGLYLWSVKYENDFIKRHFPGNADK